MASRSTPIPFLMERSHPVRGRWRLYALGGQAQDAHASPSSRRVHRPDVELRVIEQRQVHLPAHRGNVGLVEEELGGMSPAVALGIAERPWSIGDLLDAVLALEGGEGQGCGCLMLFSWLPSLSDQ
jgi:hypothetical protein